MASSTFFSLRDSGGIGIRGEMVNHERAWNVQCGSGRMDAEWRWLKRGHSEDTQTCVDVDR